MLTLTVADLEWFTPKNKPVTSTGVLIELYNWKNHVQVHELYGIIELKKMRTSIVENIRNLDAYRIIEISLILHSAHVVSRDQDKIMFYINNYIDWD